MRNLPSRYVQIFRQETNDILKKFCKKNMDSKCILSARETHEISDMYRTPNENNDFFPRWRTREIKTHSKKETNKRY